MVFELVVLELYTPAVVLARTEVKMDVRMVGIAMDSAERDRFRKRLLKKVIRQIPDLFVRSRDIKREDYPVMGPAAFSFLVVLKRRK